MTMNARYNAGYTLLTVLLTFLVISLLAYRSMEYLQEKNDVTHKFSEEDALLALPQFRLVDTAGGLLQTLLSNDPGAKPMRGPYVVLAGSFLTEEKAKLHLSQLQKLGLEYTELVHFVGNQNIYAIAVGKHIKLKDANDQLESLRREFGVNGYVHKIREAP